MPTYAYACTECGHTFEAVQSFSDDSLTECPQCTGRLRKVFSNVGIVFKGSGFYRTDSRAGDPAEAKGAKDGAGKDSGGSKDGAGKDSAPKEGAAKADTKGSGSSGTGTSSAPAAAKSGSSAGSAA